MRIQSVWRMEMSIKRVYVAGLLSPKGTNSVHPAIDYLLNLRNLTRESLKVFFAGFTPFCPALDFLFFLLLQPGEHITEPMIKRFSKDWLDVCDAVVLTPGWRKSGGTLAEIKRAEELGIPVYETLKELKEANEKEADSESSRV